MKMLEVFRTSLSEETSNDESKCQFDKTFSGLNLQMP